MSEEKEVPIAEDDDIMEDEEKKEGEEEKITDDGGVVKKVLKKGEGWKKPTKDSEVTVHYVGKLLDGTVFDSSREKNQPFTFKLGVHQVIKGWDKGVATMLKGEVAQFIIKSDYAYGKAGSPPSIPADATLQFEVELISWTDEKDLSSNKDGGVRKKILKEGEGWDTPREESKVTVKLTGRLLDKNDEPSTVFEPEHTLEFVVGEEQVIEGIEVCVESMKQGEHALLTLLPKYAYGEKGNELKQVPANAKLQYDVELLELIKEKESWDMNAQEKIDAALKRKNEGNELFKESKFQRALKKYKKAMTFLDSETGLSDEEKGKAKELKLPLYLNLAACKLHTKEYSEVKENCKKALEIDPSNTKALLRRGKAFIELDEWDSAKQDLNKALEVDPNNVEIKKELVHLNKKIANQNAKDKKMYKGLFEKLSMMEEREQKVDNNNNNTKEEKKEKAVGNN